MSRSISPQHPLALRVPPLVVAACCGGVIWFAARAAAGLRMDFIARPAVAAAFAGLGIVFGALGVGMFQRARTTVNPTKPERATTLVTAGVYRISRNPMYLGFLLFLWAEALWVANPLGLIGLAAFVISMNCFQIAPEEAALQARFGTAYTQYTRRVRRWL